MLTPSDLDARLFALMWALVVGLLVYVPLVALAWANKYRLRWPLTGLFVMYIAAMALLLINLKR
jgi:hypothetical protein